jgi:hypothetical protein
LVSAVVAALTLVGAVTLAFFNQRAVNIREESEQVREQLAFKLIRTFASIEQELLEYEGRLGSEVKPSRPLSLREVKSAMIAGQVWNTDDQINFDLATRTRNSIVHGDLEKLGLLDLRYANEKADALLAKMRNASRAGQRGSKTAEDTVSIGHDINEELDFRFRDAAQGREQARRRFSDWFGGNISRQAALFFLPLGFVCGAIDAWLSIQSLVGLTNPKGVLGYLTATIAGLALSGFAAFLPFIRSAFRSLLNTALYLVVLSVDVLTSIAGAIWYGALGHTFKTPIDLREIEISSGGWPSMAVYVIFVLVLTWLTYRFGQAIVTITSYRRENQRQ